MGNDNSTGIKINVDRDNLFYYSGEIISGIVTLDIAEKNLETHEIYINLIGEIGYTTTGSGLNTTSGPLPRHHYHRIQFYNKKVNLSEYNIIQQESLSNQREYSWPFQILLIDNLPPSINKPNAFPRVRYFLQVIIDQPWYISNIKYKKYLTIYPHVNLIENSQCLLPSIFEYENRQDIILKATFNKLGYISGENIQFTIEIQNPRKICIQYINLSMLKCYQIEKKFDESILYKIMLPKIVNLTNEQIIETFSIKIPSISLPPSYKYNGENENIFVHIYYMLKLTVKVDGIFTNCHINIPITIGTKSNFDLNQQETFNPLSISFPSNPEQSIINDDDDSPPDYDSVIQNLQ